MTTEHWIYLAALAAVAALLWFANRKGRPVQPWRLVLRPFGFTAGTIFALSTSPLTDVRALLAYAVVAVLGLAAGFVIARNTTLSPAPNGGVTSRMSPLGFVLFIMLFAGRFAFRSATNQGQIWHRLAHHSADVTLIINAGMVFLMALALAQAFEVWRRARPLRARYAAERSGAR